MRHINNGVIEAESATQAEQMLESMQRQGFIANYYLNGRKMYYEHLPNEIDGLIDSSMNIVAKNQGYGRNLRHLIDDEDATYFPFCANVM